MNEINIRIKELRLKHKLTMAKLAAMIGVSPGNISDWENGKKKSTPTAKALISISKQFNVSLDWLMTGSEPETPTNIQNKSSAPYSPYMEALQVLAGQLMEDDLLMLQTLADHLARKNTEASTGDPYRTGRIRQTSIPADNSQLRETSLSAEYYVRLPLLGKVTAGSPILAAENIEEYFSVPKSLVGAGKYFILRILGESMVNKGIKNGDLVLVRQQSSADNGDVVVALIDGEEATVKTFYKEADHIRLQPANDAFQPLLPENDVSILGRVVSVLRDAE
ncbi:transcriptional repressor LexA [Paenibacillus lutrae]|uniref:Repressor LexA n=1 Tax=Paenibacillus lutrae TaxID=2078573 RepID=A0A7X3FGC5_9BACL|nr:transcriptional repressor LexA [Paenibacillus lutrae]MVO98891.1 repressor LexA [Paenibacillus lutrae]